jgi:hypothetical protein
LKTVLAVALAGSIPVALPAVAAPEIHGVETAPGRDHGYDQGQGQNQGNRKGQAAHSAAAEDQECNAKWTEEKAKSGAKGRTAYRKFLGECLKAPAT